VEKSFFLFVSYFHFTDEQIYYIIVFEDFALTKAIYGTTVDSFPTDFRASMLKYGTALNNKEKRGNY
jgi:hypothetical protein